MDKKLSQIAAEVGVSNQSIKNWVDTFPNHFSDTAQRPTGKRYDERDQAILHQIKQWRDDGFIMDQIAEKLHTFEPDFVILNQDPKDDTSALQTLEMSRSIQDIIREVTDSITAAKDQTINVLQDRIRDRDDTIEDLKSEIERLRKPWWKR